MASSNRTTIVLGAAERKAAKALALRWRITASAAIRKAILLAESREQLGHDERAQRRRVRQFETLLETFSGKNSLAAELKRIGVERDEW